MKPKFLILTISFLFFSHCKSIANEENNKIEYNDGEYCAEIEYYNPNTGTNSTYTLVVEIENNELTVIHWPNGGWLDRTHFTPPDISEGNATFISDTGAEYNVTILSSDINCN